MSDGFRVPPRQIRKGFEGEKPLAISKWEAEMLLHQFSNRRFYHDEHPIRTNLIRPMPIQPESERGYFNENGSFMKGGNGSYCGNGSGRLPYPMEYKSGQHFWCQEPWQIVEWTRDWESGYYEECYTKCEKKGDKWVPVKVPDLEAYYIGSMSNSPFDTPSSIAHKYGEDWYEEAEIKFRSAASMPRWASRFDILVLNVHARQLNDVDVRRTGICTTDKYGFDGWQTNREQKERFFREWNRRYGRKFHSGKNPWVYEISMRVISESEYLYSEILRLRKELGEAKTND